MQGKVNSIVRAFQDQEEKVEFLFMSDATFRELCTDYILCASKILDLKMGSEECIAQIKEYEDVQQNLEQEILKLITIKKYNLEKF